MEDALGGTSIGQTGEHYRDPPGHRVVHPGKGRAGPHLASLASKPHADRPGEQSAAARAGTALRAARPLSGKDPPTVLQNKLHRDLIHFSLQRWSIFGKDAHA